jgi:hypothetical protein
MTWHILCFAFLSRSNPDRTTQRIPHSQRMNRSFRTIGESSGAVEQTGLWWMKQFHCSTWKNIRNRLTLAHSPWDSLATDYQLWKSKERFSGSEQIDRFLRNFCDLLRVFFTKSESLSLSTHIKTGSSCVGAMDLPKTGNRPLPSIQPIIVNSSLHERLVDSISLKIQCIRNHRKGCNQTFLDITGV